MVYLYYEKIMNIKIYLEYIKMCLIILHDHRNLNLLKTILLSIHFDLISIKK